MLIFQTWSIEYRKSFAKKVLISYSSVFLLIPLALIASEYKLLLILLPYIQICFFCIVILSLYIATRNNPQALALLPSKIIGIVIYTYAGIIILSKTFDQKYKDSVKIVEKLLSSIIMLETDFRGKIRSFFRVYSLIEWKMLTYFGCKVVGVLIVDKDSLILRDILRNIINRYERESKVLDEGFVSDESIKLAEKIATEYIVFLYK